MIGKPSPVKRVPPPLPDEDIVFASIGTTKRIKPDGSGLRDFGPFVAPTGSLTTDRSRIAGNDGRGLAVLETATGAVTSITGSIGTVHAASISPDGLRVAYQRENQELVVARVADGTVLGKADGLSLNPYVPPRWSPDGASLLVEIDGSVALVDAGHLDNRKLFKPNVTSASWSPDGTKIAASVADKNEPEGIYVFDTHAGIATPVSTSAGQAGTTVPTWSPNGTRIAFVVSPRGDFFDSKALCVLDLSSGAIVMVGNQVDARPSPAWSADSSWLAYTTESTTGSSDLHVTAATGGSDQHLGLPDTDLVSEPIWTTTSSSRRE